MSGIKLHPTARLIVWLLLLFGIQGVSGGGLIVCFFARSILEARF